MTKAHTTPDERAAFKQIAEGILKRKHTTPDIYWTFLLRLIQDVEFYTETTLPMTPEHAGALAHTLNEVAHEHIKGGEMRHDVGIALLREIQPYLQSAEIRLEHLQRDNAALREQRDGQRQETEKALQECETYRQQAEELSRWRVRAESYLEQLADEKNWRSVRIDVDESVSAWYGYFPNIKGDVRKLLAAPPKRERKK